VKRGKMLDTGSLDIGGKGGHSAFYVFRCIEGGKGDVLVVTLVPKLAKRKEAGRTSVM